MSDTLRMSCASCRRPFDQPRKLVKRSLCVKCTNRLSNPDEDYPGLDLSLVKMRRYDTPESRAAAVARRRLEELRDYLELGLTVGQLGFEKLDLCQER